jgi:hypothetical protein
MRVNKDVGVAAYQGQAFKDTAAFGALGNIATAGQNAMGQYGVSRNNALADQSVAAANAYGQMANNFYNTMGQLGHIGGSLASAGLSAGAQAGSARQGSFANFGSSAGGGSGGGSFFAGGPEGRIASGGAGGGGPFGGSMSGGGGSWSNAQRGASSAEREGMVSQGLGFLGGLTSTLNSNDNQAMALAGLMGKEFAASRNGIMDPTITRSLNNQMASGYNALGSLYGMSDYGFNTSAAKKGRL